MRAHWWKRSWLVLFSLAGCLLPFTSLPAQPVATVQPALSAEQLERMNWCELEQIYHQAEPGAVPDGYAPGRAIYCPDSLLTPARSRVTRTLWHGKLFCSADGTLINQWCLGVHAIRARVYYGTSWLDGKPSIIMDYCGMSHVWANVRDELREVAPGLYLGIMYNRKTPCQIKTFFVLDATCAARCPGGS
jgi:hypothetical protein